MNGPRGGSSPPATSRSAGLPTAPGVVETIAAGLSLVLVYPALVTVPLLVDALLWSGLRISPGALAERSRTAAETLRSLGLDQDLLRWTQVTQLFVPTLLTWIDRDRLFTIGGGVTVSPASWWSVALALVGIVLVGVFVHAAYRVPIAFVVRRQPLRLAAVARSVGLVWVRLLGLAAIVGLAFVLLVFPLLVVGGLLTLLGVDATALIGSFIVVPAVLAAVCLYFAPDAIAVSEVGPWRACYLSFNVVRRNVWSVLGLIGSIVLIWAGLPVLWLSQADHPIGLLIGAFGSALVSTGLVLASMQFYRDRLARWQTVNGAPPPRLGQS